MFIVSVALCTDLCSWDYWKQAGESAQDYQPWGWHEVSICC